jgi:hypothetical protein
MPPLTEVEITGATASNPEKISELIAFAREMFQLELELDEDRENSLAFRLRAAQIRLRELSTTIVPERMKELNLPALPLSGGYTLETKPLFEASIPSVSAIESAPDEIAAALIARREGALKWLEKNKAGSIISTQMKIALGKGQTALARKVVAFLKTLKLSAETSRTVHPGSLKKHLRELLEAGKDVPFDLFQIYSGTQARVKPPKKEKEPNGNKTKQQS